MEWFPALGFGWLNGWIMLCIFYAIFGLMVIIFPKETVNRLYDRTGWSQSQMTISKVIKYIALICFVLMFLSPLKVGAPAFITGMILYVLGTMLMIVALVTFRDTPLGQPVAGGVYRASRNPQWVALVLVTLGIAIAIGSWIVTILAVIITALGHFRIRAEEETCLNQYGESYRQYMERVPRYLWIL